MDKHYTLSIQATKRPNETYTVCGFWPDEARAIAVIDSRIGGVIIECEETHRCLA